MVHDIIQEPATKTTSLEVFEEAGVALAEARVRLVAHVVARRVGGDLRQGGARGGGVDPHVEAWENQNHALPIVRKT